MEANVLVLNASYEAINVCNLRRAMKMLVKVSDLEIRSPTMSMKIPLVIRLVNYVHIPHCVVKFSRKNVLTRDQYTCQYCDEHFPPSTLTIDHVKPRSRGGTTVWENVATACKRCNAKKGDRTPHEAGMFPKRSPKAPSIISYLHLSRNGRSYDESWKKYLYIN
ncbi:HNH endonuclease [Candidatus Poribacteria bacterium]|nr:HNH endonuclease [Candidatus Poribacteria bacterium]